MSEICTDDSDSGFLATNHYSKNKLQAQKPVDYEVLGELKVQKMRGYKTATETSKTP